MTLAGVGALGIAAMVLASNLRAAREPRVIAEAPAPAPSSRVESPRTVLADPGQWHRVEHRRPAGPPAPAAHTRAATAISWVSPTEKLATLASLHARFLESGSWSDGYDLMYESILSCIDRQSPSPPARSDRVPKGVRPNDTYHTYDDGREYSWNAMEFLAMAEMIEAHESLRANEDARSLRLTDVQRLEVIETFERARTELERAR